MLKLDLIYHDYLGENEGVIPELIAATPGHQLSPTGEPIPRFKVTDVPGLAELAFYMLKQQKLAAIRDPDYEFEEDAATESCHDWLVSPETGVVTDEQVEAALAAALSRMRSDPLFQP